MLDFVKEKFARIPPQYRRWPTLGALAILLIVLPITVFGLLTGKFEIRKRAASGEVTPTPTPIQEPNFLACNTDKDCACGTNEVTNQCAVGNKGYIDTSRQCPDFCGGINGKLTTQCISGLCQQVRISPTPTCKPRPACLDREVNPCKMPETIDMCPRPTPTQPNSQKAQLSFKIKLQGIKSQKPNKAANIILKQNNQEKAEFPKIEVVTDQNGVYIGNITQILPGTYDLYLKVPGHLQKKFSGLTLNADDNVQDFSGIELLAGDTNGDNRVNAQDLVVLIQQYQPNTPPNSPADFNADGVVNAQDIRFVIENYRKEGDE